MTTTTTAAVIELEAAGHGYYRCTAADLTAALAQYLPTSQAALADLVVERVACDEDEAASYHRLELAALLVMLADWDGAARRNEEEARRAQARREELAAQEPTATARLVERAEGPKEARYLVNGAAELLTWSAAYDQLTAGPDKARRTNPGHATALLAGAAAAAVAAQDEEDQATLAWAQATAAARSDLEAAAPALAARSAAIGAALEAPLEELELAATGTCSRCGGATVRTEDGTLHEDGAYLAAYCPRDMTAALAALEDRARRRWAELEAQGPTT